MYRKQTQREKKAAAENAAKVEEESKHAEALISAKEQKEEIQRAIIADQERAERERQENILKGLKVKYANIKTALFTYGYVPEKNTISIDGQKFVKKYIDGCPVFMHKDTINAIEQCQIHLEIESIDGMLQTTEDGVSRTIQALTNDMVFDELTLTKKNHHIAYFIEKFKFYVFDELDLDLKAITSDPNCSLLVYYYIIYCRLYMIGMSEKLNLYQKKISQAHLVYLIHLWSCIVVSSNDISDAIIAYYDDNEGIIHVSAVSSEFSIRSLGLR